MAEHADLDDSGAREVRAWLRAGAAAARLATPWGDGDADFAVFRNLTDDRGARRCSTGSAAIAQAALRRRLRRDRAARRARRRRVVARLRRRVRRRRSRRFEVPPSTELISVTTGLVGPTIGALRHRRAARDATPGRSCARTCWPASCSASRAPAPTSPRSRRRAVRDGDELGDQRSEGVDVAAPASPTTAMLLARTDPDVPKQAGITVFLVPLDPPGVEIRPIRQMSGAAVVQRGVPLRRAHQRRPAGRRRSATAGRSRTPPSASNGPRAGRARDARAAASTTCSGSPAGRPHR